MKLKVSDQVRGFLRQCAPEPRRAIGLALDRASSGSGLEPLEAPLDGFYKIRVGKYRILCAVRGQTVYAIFAESRPVVYEIATPIFLTKILRRMEEES